MDLVGGWIRQLVGAGLVAALVPVAILASLVVVLAGAGGLGGLGSLGQLVNGPQISSAQRVVAATPSERSRELALVAPPTLVAAASQPGEQPPASGAPQRSARREVPGPPSRVVPLSPPVVKLPPAVAVPPPAAPPAPPATPTPTSKDRTEKVVGDLAETVDDVVGVVGEVIGGVGETLGGILDGPPPRR